MEFGGTVDAGETRHLQEHPSIGFLEDADDSAYFLLVALLASADAVRARDNIESCAPQRCFTPALSSGPTSQALTARHFGLEWLPVTKANSWLLIQRVQCNRTALSRSRTLRLHTYGLSAAQSFLVLCMAI